MPPAARLPRVSPDFGMRARLCGKGLPSITSTRLSPCAISGMKRCAITVRLPQSVIVSTITLRFTSRAVTRKIIAPPMPSSFFSTTSPCASMKSLTRFMSLATSVGGVSSGKARMESFSFQSRSARGLLDTRVPSASARSRRSVA